MSDYGSISWIHQATVISSTMTDGKSKLRCRNFVPNSLQLGPYRQIHQGPAFSLPPKRAHRSTRERYIQDTRIHCCLFFIQPSGHALKPIDIVVLKKLSDVVNVVPVIAKSDSLTLEERRAFKERIKEEFAFHNIKMYPYDNDEQDDEERATNTTIKDIIPFAVVGSEKSIVVNGKQVRGRQNRWGIINVEDENHCEFVYLRISLLEHTSRT